MINLDIEKDLLETLKGLAVSQGFDQIETYIIYILIKEKNSMILREKIPDILNKVQDLHSNTIFDVYDLIDNKSKRSISISVLQEIDSILDLYLYKNQKLDEFELLYFDTVTLLNTYLKR